MYRVLLFIMTALFFGCLVSRSNKSTVKDQKDYTLLWNGIDSLERLGFPRSALDRVQTLKVTSRKSNDWLQYVKANIYESKYKLLLEEEAEEKILEFLESEIKQVPSAEASIIRSYLGGLYADYLYRNSWKRVSKNMDSNEPAQDIGELSLKDIEKRAMRFYLRSIEDVDILGKSVYNYQELIKIIDTGATYLRPVLYDVLVARALDYVGQEPYFLPEPTEVFSLDQPGFLKTWREFINLPLEFRDTFSHTFQALKIYQNWMKFYQNDSVPDVLVDIDLRRLNYVWQFSSLPDKDDLYMQALQSLQEIYNEGLVSAEISYHRANFIYNKASQSQRNGSKEYSLVDAHTICKEAIRQFPDSYGARLCRDLVHTIESKSVSMEFEQVILPNQYTLVKLSYRNVDTMYLKVVPVSRSQWLTLKHNHPDSLLRHLLSQIAIHKWTSILPLPDDYRQHSTEIRIPPLPTGLYGIICSSGKDFKLDGNTIGYLTVFASNWSLTQLTGYSGEPLFLCTNRKSGSPVPDLMAEWYVPHGNVYDRNRKYTKLGNTFSDSMGLLIPPEHKEGPYLVILQKGNDWIEYDGMLGRYFVSREHEPELKTYFFTDRSIYRPGQTVHFKGLVMEEAMDSAPHLLKNYPVKVLLYDTNHRIIEEKQFTTSRFGSFNGSFILPSHGLEGSLEIFSDAGRSSTYIQVEQYRRPNFEVVIDSIRSAPKLGDTVQITGSAQALAGFEIDGARFSYLVTRRSIIPWIRGYGMIGNIYEKEISFGQGTTDDKGRFEFRFHAEGDADLPRPYFPEFVFEMDVTVTDINGETQSSRSSIVLGLTGYRFNIAVPEFSDIRSFSEFKLISENYQGEQVAVRGEIKVNRIEPLRPWFKERYWDLPEYDCMPEDSFRSLFLFMAYRDEHKMENWKILNEMFVRTFDTQVQSRVDVSGVRWTPGTYRVEAWIDGEKTPIIQFFQLGNMARNEVPTTKLLAIRSLHEQHEPGDTAELILSTAQYPSHVFLQITRRGKSPERTWFRLDRPARLKIPIFETDRGDIHISANRVFENRVMTENKVLDIPWSNRELKLELTGLPEKMDPGSTDTFQITVQGPGDKDEPSELLIAMYDASLDKLYPHQWALPEFPRFSGGHWFYNPGYGLQYAIFREKDWNPLREDFAYRSYPVLDDFGLRFRPAYVLRSMESAAEVSGPEVPDSDIPAEADQVQPPTSKSADQLHELRTDLGETVFFYPDLQTDENGRLVVRFVMKDALTRWRLMAFAHTPDISNGYLERGVVTQKELMIIPNLPRFLRQSDTAKVRAKLSNLTAAPIAGDAILDFRDIITGEPLSSKFIPGQNQMAFELLPGQSQIINWDIVVPATLKNPVRYEFKAISSQYSDGQTGVIPVLSNQILVTESMIMPVPGGSTRKFSFDRFEENNSRTLTHHSYTLSYESDPIIHAISALPSVMEYQDHCSEAVFNSLFAWSIGSGILSQSPEIVGLIKSTLVENESREIEQTFPQSGLLNLDETPWLQEALVEPRHMQMLEWLLDPNMVSNHRDKTLATLTTWQNEDGGFPWFQGGQSNWFITQNIMEGFGQMRKLNWIHGDSRTEEIIHKGLEYLDHKIEQEYLTLEKKVTNNEAKWSDDHLSPLIINYLYVRSMFSDRSFAGEESGAWNFFLDQATTFWTKQIPLLKGMISLTLHRNGRSGSIPAILRSLKELSISEPNRGIHWKRDAGFHWYQLPVETQALMIEVFETLGDDPLFVEELCTWLLSHKTTNRWPTSKATSSAILALWLHHRGEFHLADPVEIIVDKERLQAGSKISHSFSLSPTYKWFDSEIDKSLSPVEISNPNKHMTWGFIQWQYFETPEKITTDATSELSIKRTLLKQIQTGSGMQLVNLEMDEEFSVGDKIRVLLHIRSLQDMEFVKIRDLRSAALEPTVNISGYKWSGGLSYYENPEDLATNFYIDKLPRGYHTLAYDLVVNLGGNFGSGLATIECMYAPQFRSHSESDRFESN